MSTPARQAAGGAGLYGVPPGAETCRHASEAESKRTLGAPGIPGH